MCQTNVPNLFQQDFVSEESVCATAQEHPRGYEVVNTAKDIPGGFGTHLRAVGSPPCLDMSCPVHGELLKQSYETLKSQVDKTKPPE
jgi:hypothetical protein